jgi:hypothetical protein
MIRRLVFVLIFLSAPALVQAQTHYCDTTPPTSGQAAVGATVTVQNCQDNKSTNGLPVTIMSWTLYVNGVGQSITMTKGTTSPVSGKTAYSGTVVFTTAGSRTLQTTATGHDVGPDIEAPKSNVFTLSVVTPSGPTAPTNLTAQ